MALNDGMFSANTSGKTRLPAPGHMVRTPPAASRRRRVVLQLHGARIKDQEPGLSEYRPRCISLTLGSLHFHQRSKGTYAPAARGRRGHIISTATADASVCPTTRFIQRHSVRMHKAYRTSSTFPVVYILRNSFAFVVHEHPQERTTNKKTRLVAGVFVHARRCTNQNWTERRIEARSNLFSMSVSSR
jgi:hypothetical protein